MSIPRNAYYALPPSVRRISRRIWFLPSDIKDALTRARGPMVPPKGKIFIGSGDFVKAGEAIKDQLVAVPLTAYLNEKGSYEGFDIVKSAINWCTRNIHSRFRNLRFTHMVLADVENYLEQIHRVLKPGGRCFATFFWSMRSQKP